MPVQDHQSSIQEAFSEPFTLETLTRAAARLRGGLDDDRARFASKMLGARTFKARRKAVRVKLLAKAEEIMKATRGGYKTIRNAESMFMFSTGPKCSGIIFDDLAHLEEP